MTTYGLTPQGYVPKPAPVIKSEMEARYRDAFGANVPLGPRNQRGKVIGIESDMLGQIHDLLQVVAGSYDPDQATGTALVTVCAVTGTIPKDATHSKVTLTLTGNNGTSIVTGKVASTVGLGKRFDTLANATLATATAWTGTHAYVVGDYRTNAGNMYVCITAGTSASSGGPTTTDSDITDGSGTPAHWRYLGAGAAYARVDSEAEETGPVSAAEGTLTQIETPVSGWLGVINELDADQGTDLENDTELRIRRENELPGEALGALAAIRNGLIKRLVDAQGEPTVSTVFVFANDTETTDGNGLPPHSVECLVRQNPVNGATDQEVLDAVFATVAAGITYYGTTSGTVTDTENGNQSYTVKFSKPDEVTIYIDVAVIKDPAVFPSDGEDEIKNALVALGDTYAVGQDVTSWRLKTALKDIPGILDVTHLYIKTSATPTVETTITITARQLALFDTGRITVGLSDGSP